MNKENLAAHIAQLAKLHAIEIAPRASYGGRAFKRTRRVCLRPIRSQVTYAVALHEIGHVAGRQPRTRLDREAAAWIWARSNAIFWTDAMQAKMMDCLRSYARKAERKMLRGTPMADSRIFYALLNEPARETRIAGVAEVA